MPEIATSVKISIEEGTLEISGSERYVTATVKNPKDVLKLYDELQQAYAENEAEKSDEQKKVAAEFVKNTNDAMKKILQLMQEMNAAAGSLLR